MTTPRMIEEITPQWLGAALSERYPGTVVDTITVEDVMPGMAMKVRVRPRYGAGSPPLPETLIVKGHLNAHDLGNAFSFELEMRSYADIVPSFGVNTPALYFAGTGAGGPVVILEDLRPRNVRFLNLLQPLDRDQAADVLSSLARMHARWWDHPDLRDGVAPEWLSASGPVRAELDAYFRHCVSPAIWDPHSDLPRGTALPCALRDRTSVAAALERFLAFRLTQPMTLGHGDEHLANLFVEPDGSIGFLDWQVRQEPWSVGFAFFLTIGLDILDRRAWEKKLLAHYLAELARAGAPAPSFDEGWQAYRESAIFPYIIWYANQPTWQPESYITAAVSRAAWAAWDLDIFGL